MALKSQIKDQKSQIIYEPGLQYSRDKSTADFAKTVAAAKKSDVILFFAGEEAILSGEARCRTDLNLPGAQRELFAALKATGKPIVLIVMAGRPLTIGAEMAQANAVLYAYHGGTMAGPGIANVLTGKAVPSGKTTTTFPKTVGQVPFYYNRHNTGRPSYEPPTLIDDIPVGSPQFSIGQSSYWLETATEPLIPFGFGLSYTTFEYSEPMLDGMTVSCELTNTGSVDAFEVTQLYTRQLSGEFVRPICELKGFQKIFIPAGERRMVTFTLTEKQLGYWHEAKHDCESRVWFATDKADYRVWIAPDSRCQTKPVTITIK